MTDRLEFVWRDGTTHNTPPPETDYSADYREGFEAGLVVGRLECGERHAFVDDQQVCPYVRTSDEGTSYCSLGVA